jgi:hypothetical protein
MYGKSPHDVARQSLGTTNDDTRSVMIPGKSAVRLALA